MRTILRASTFERRLCPGSVKAESGLPDLPDEGGVAESGKKIHNALRMYFSGTVTDIADIITLCELNEREGIVLKWFTSRADAILAQHGGAVHRYPEYKLDDTGDSISGTADFVAICGDHTYHLFDWKSGWGRQITAELNLQLRVYAVKVAEKFGCIGLTAHLFAAGNDPAESAFTSCLYGPDEIAEARKEIYAIRDACFTDDPPRRPSVDRCKYCRANGNPQRCPESCIIPKMDLAIVEKPITPALAEEAKRIYLAFKMLEKAQDRFTEWLKEAIKAQPEAIPWARLKAPSQRRQITDAEKTFIVGCTEGWFNQKEFVRECITVKMPAVEKLAKRTGKQKEVEPKLTDAGAVEIKETAPSIELVKEKNEKETKD